MSCYYVGLDVHKASICIAVLNADGKSVMESIVETSASTVLDSIKGLRGQVEVTFEEGTHAAWLYDVLKQTTATVIVCDPRRNRLLQDGNKSDKVDARKLAQLLRAGLLSPVYHGEHGTRDLKELVRSYEYLVEEALPEKSKSILDIGPGGEHTPTSCADYRLFGQSRSKIRRAS